ncbi:MAG TPA: hypothetical protein VH186_37510 [Chloroflexia bacterium]|nr:hypothetical protein [Chloroflexia bacterium]
MTDTLTTAYAFECFVDQIISPAIPGFTSGVAGSYSYTHELANQKCNRRLLVIKETNSNYIRILLEVEYQLFEGDTHLHVHEVDRIETSEASLKLLTLVREAYEQLVNWRPCLNNIEDNAYLPC